MKFDDIIEINRDKYYVAQDILINKDKSQNKNIIEYDKIGGTRLFERSKIIGTHSFFDFEITIQYLKTLNCFKNKIILDLGCGDGRFTLWFLEKTNAYIVCVDSNVDNLIRLKKNVNYEIYKDRLILINSDILNLPMFKIKFDIIWSFETLYYLNDKYNDGIKIVSDLLKKDGELFNTDRNYFGGVIHSLLSGGIKDFLSSLESQTIFDYWGDSKPQSIVITDDYFERTAKKFNLDVINKIRLPIFTTLISYLVSNEKILFEDIQKNYKKILSQINAAAFGDELSRATLYISKKTKGLD